MSSWGDPGRRGRWSPAAPTSPRWLYFNFTDDTEGVFRYVSLLVGGDIAAGQGRGGPLLQLQRHGQPPLKFTTEVPVRPDDISLARVDLRLGSAATAVFRDGAYRLHLNWHDARGPAGADLIVRPRLDFYYPPVLIHGSEAFVSGYRVPALRAMLSGTIRAPDLALTFDEVPGYHDHNWGTWWSVSWEWGTASNAAQALLYGRVQHPDIDPGRAGAGLFVLLAQARSTTQRGGALGLFRPRDIQYEWQETSLPGDPARVPRRLSMNARSVHDSLSAFAAADEITVALGVRTVAATPPRAGEHLVFLQVQGNYSVHARIAGRPLRFEAPGFAEVFVPPRASTGNR